jgi:AraC-like DNA-binding protein
MMFIHTKPATSAWPAAMIVWGPGYRATAHRHHSIQLIMATKGTFRIRGGRRDRWLRCGAALVRPDAVHEIDARATPVLIAFVDVESSLGLALNEAIESDIFPIPPTQLARWRARLGASLSGRRIDRWSRMELLRERTPPRIHPKVQRVIKYLQERVGIADDFSLKTLAEIAGLSETRFMHVFTESVGVPLRPYILWLRLQCAACDLIHGQTVTQAAHNAGFADAAHLTRTFRRMLGTSPTELSLRKRMSRAVSVPKSPHQSSASQISA